MSELQSIIDNLDNLIRNEQFDRPSLECYSQSKEDDCIKNNDSSENYNNSIGTPNKQNLILYLTHPFYKSNPLIFNWLLTHTNSLKIMVEMGIGECDLRFYERMWEYLVFKIENNNKNEIEENKNIEKNIENKSDSIEGIENKEKEFLLNALNYLLKKAVTKCPPTKSLTKFLKASKIFLNSHNFKKQFFVESDLRNLVSGNCDISGVVLKKKDVCYGLVGKGFLENRVFSLRRKI